MGNGEWGTGNGEYFSPSFVLRYAATVFANAIRLLTSCSCVSST